MRIETSGYLRVVEPDRPMLALRLYEITCELRPDREPPLPHTEWATLAEERRLVLKALGWKPNEGNPRGKEAKP